MRKTYDLRPVWDALLDIYKAMADICERHNLRFFVAGGNCLGAVRHKGFIPWDNDMDVFLHWEDYDKFLAYAEKELSENFKIVGWWNTPEYGNVFCKILETRKAVVEDVESKSSLKLGQGIFVDVFPLSNCPNSLFEKFMWKISGFFLKLKSSIVLNSGKRKTLRSKLVGLCGRFFGWIYPSLRDNQSAMKIHESRARKYGKRKDGCCGWYMTNICDVVIPMPADLFDDFIYLPYDSIKVPVPKHFSDYLKCEFGDYMQLPPEGKRTVSNHGYEGEVPWRLGPTGKDVRLTKRSNPIGK